MPTTYPLAYSTLGCPDWPLEKAAEQAAAAGYQGLEIRILDGQIIPSDLPPDAQARVRSVMAQHGLTTIGLGVSTRFASTDGDERRSNLAELQRYLELANALECPMVRTFGGDVQPGSTINQTVDWVAENLAAAMPTADAQGVTVVLETHDAFCRGAEVARVLDQVEHPRLKAVWDVHHPFRMGESIEDTWRLIGSRVAHIHLKDAKLREDGSWQLVLLGQGEVPCRDIVQLLHREGYNGWISAEWEKKWHPEIEEPEVAMPQHVEALQGWFQEL